MPKNEMDRAGRIIIKICIFSIVLSLTALFLCAIFNFINKAESTWDDNAIPTLIIDAGHGGEDGGAVSAGGISEKDLNLSVALTLSDMLRSAGYRVVLTRNDDSMLYTDKEKGSLKMQDLKSRIELANNIENGIFVSIHMNKFSQEKYSGLQVFYSNNSRYSTDLAQKIQTNTKKYIQPENKREVKDAGRNIYIMERSKNPAVLIECGFLSNKDECKKLTESEYRKQIGSVIYASLVEFITTL